MAGVEALAGLLAVPPERRKRASQFLDRFLVVMFVLLIAFFVLVCVAAIRFFLNAWTTGQWDLAYWENFSLQVSVPLIALAIQIPLVALKWTTPYSPEQLRAALSVVRGIAVDGAGNLAAVDADLHERLREEPVVNLPVRFEAMGRPTGDQEVNYLFGSGVALTGALACPFIALAVLVLAGPADHVPLVVGLCIGSAVLCVLGMRDLLRGLRLGRRVTIEADTWGIRVALPEEHARELSVAWHEARSFFTLKYRTEWQSGDQHAFVLDTDGAAIVWKVAARDASEAAETSDSLCALLAAQTGLVPRDLTDVARQLTARRWIPAYTWMFDAVVANSSAIGNEALSQAVHMLPRPARLRTVMRPALTLMTALLLVPALLWGAGKVGPRYQQQSYGDLLRQVRTHTPLYRDALDVAGGDWPVHAPTANDGREMVYAGGGSYQLHDGQPDPSSASYLTAWPRATYHDVAVEVTVQISRGVEYGESGLALRGSDDSNDMMLFGIGTGWWDAHRYHSTAPSPGGFDLGTYTNDNENTIHPGNGALNRLTVILRGSQVICYINDRFVGVYNDPMPHAGHMGVYVNFTGVQATFSNFVIYPL